MKAIAHDAYGSFDILELREIERPAVGDYGVLIRVHAASVHIGDWHVMTGFPYMLRFVGFGLFAPKIRVRGMDVAGNVEAVGSRVTRFRVGDEVFGTCDGGFAEYACAPEDNFVSKPANLTFEQAAAVPTSGTAALQALRDRGELRQGQKILIIGASGGVGMFAVQIARALGAEVTGVCSTSKINAVRTLGADHVIDYKNEDFTEGGPQYDVILDMGGKRSLSHLRRVLRQRGILVLVGGEGGGRWLGCAAQWVHALLLAPFVGHKLRPLATTPRKVDLEYLKELIESGKVKPVIDRTYPLSQVPKAMQYVQEGRAVGKVVITV